MGERINDQQQAELDAERLAELRGISFSEAVRETGYNIEASEQQVTADAITARNSANTYYDQQFGLTQNWQELPEEQQATNEQGLNKVYEAMGWERPSQKDKPEATEQTTVTSEVPAAQAEAQPRRSAFYIPTMVHAKPNLEIAVRPIDQSRARYDVLDKALRFPVGPHQVDRIPLNSAEYKGVMRSEKAFLADATASSDIAHAGHTELRREEARITTQIHFLESKIKSQLGFTTGLEKEVSDLGELVALLPNPERAVMPHTRMEELVDRFVFTSVANMIDVVGDDHNVPLNERNRAMEAVIRSLKTGGQSGRTESAFGLLDLAHRYAIARKGLFESRTVQAERARQTKLNELESFLSRHGLHR